MVDAIIAICSDCDLTEDMDVYPQVAWGEPLPRRLFSSFEQDLKGRILGREEAPRWREKEAGRHHELWGPQVHVTED